MNTIAKIVGEGLDRYVGNLVKMATGTSLFIIVVVYRLVLGLSLLGAITCTASALISGKNWTAAGVFIFWNFVLFMIGHVVQRLTERYLHQ